MPDESSGRGPDGITHDWKVEDQIITEYAHALASAAEACFRYPGRHQAARDRDERDPVASGPTRVEQLRAAHRRFLRITIGERTLTMAVLDREAMKETP